MAKKRRNSRKHPGVVLIKPDKRRKNAPWRMRYVDPDAGEMTWENTGQTSRERAEAKAVIKSEALRKRREKLAQGEPRKTRSPVGETIEQFYNARKAKLAPATIDVYRLTTDKLIDWADRNGIALADHLTKKRLFAFREELANEVKANGEGKSPHSTNREMRALRRVLGYLVDRDELAQLSRNDLRLAFYLEKTSTGRKEFLKPAAIRKLLRSAIDHDALTYTDPKCRYEPVAPFLVTVLLTGMRRGEVLGLDWANVDLEALDDHGNRVGEIIAVDTKTKADRTIDLSVSPALRRLLAAQKLRTGGEGSVFGLSVGKLHAAGRRLHRSRTAKVDPGFGAPAFSWHALRRTCSTYLCNAPGIYGSSSAYRSARQLGHSVVIAERHYSGLVRGIPADVKSLEAAMHIEDLVEEIIDAVSSNERALPKVARLR